MKIQKNNKHLYKIHFVSLILEFLIIIFVLWNQLIRVHLPHIILDILENTEYIYIIILTIIIVYNIKNLVIVKKEPSNINIFDILLLD